MISALWLLDLVNAQIGFGAPPVSTPPEILKEISNELKINSAQKIYELGCGDARVTCYLAAQNPEAIFIGIDKLACAVILPKLKKELKSGATVLSMDFGFKNLQPNKTIPLRHNKNHYAQKLLVYNF